MPELYRIIKFKRNCGSCGGSLVQFQQGEAEINALPFSIGKVLVMSDIRTDDVRGLHAHYETEEILVALTGGCVVDLDDGCGRKESVHLSSSEVRDQRSEIRDQRSEIGDRRSEIRGQMSEIRDQGSKISELTSDLRPPTSQSGGCGLTSDVRLPTSADKAALLLYPHVWRVMRDFEPGTTLMVIANIQYDEADYIRDRAEFERVSKGWNDLGGSDGGRGREDKE
jgi:hypothetical protein